MPKPCFLFLVAVTLTSAALSAEPKPGPTATHAAPHAAPTAPAAVQPKALAIVRGLEIYDTCIRSLRWRQVLYSPPTSNRSWAVCDRSEFGLDQTGSWFVRSEREWVDEEEGTSGTMRLLCVSNGRAMVATSQDDQEGRLTSAESSHYMFLTSPWMVMGRLFDQTCKRRLHELFRDASDLEASDPTGPRGICSIAGTVTIDGASIRLRVTVDPSLNFAPTAIDYTAAVRDQTVQRLVALEHVQVDGVWLPTRIVRAVYNAWDPGMHRERIEAIRQYQSGLDPEAILRAFPVPALAGDPALTRVWKSLAVVETCGRDQELVVANLGVGDPAGPFTPDVAIVEWISVNQPLPDDLCLKTLPAGKRIFDGFTGRFIKTTGPAPLPEHVP